MTPNEMDENAKVDETTEFILGRMLLLNVEIVPSMQRTLASYLARQLMYDNRLK